MTIRARELPTLIFITIFSLLLLFFGRATHAEQIFTVKNNGIVAATASLKELTRIAFLDDEVDSIYALSGEMTHEVKNNNLFIKLKSEKRVTFFILTKSGNTYKVILTPKNIKAAQLFIRNALAPSRMKQEDHSTLYSSRPHYSSYPLYSSHPHYSSYSEERVLRENIAAIIKVAAANDDKAGFEVEVNDDDLGKYGWFSLKELSVWTGRALRAKKILVTNTEDRCAILSNRDFKRINLKNFNTDKFSPIAVYLEKTSLKPFESTHLILIAKPA